MIQFVFYKGHSGYCVRECTEGEKILGPGYNTMIENWKEGLKFLSFKISAMVPQGQGNCSTYVSFLINFCHVYFATKEKLHCKYLYF